MKRYSIQAKIVILVTGSVLLTAVALLATILWQRSSLEKYLNGQRELTMREQASETAGTVLRMCAMTDQRSSRRLEHDLKVLRDELYQTGAVTFEGSVSWTAVNQFDKRSSNLALPKMMLGTTWLGQNRDPAVESLIVDKLKRYTRDQVTIFQRMNDDGDMLRVSTSILAADGHRAIGTFIPRKNPDGTENPVLAAVLAGKPYRGMAMVVDRWYWTQYEPLWDTAQKSKVVGMIFAGADLEDLNRELRETLLRTEVGKTGYIAVLGAKGDARGTYRVSKDGKRDGENIWDVKDANGNPIIQDLVHQATSAKNGEVGFLRYPWKNPGDPTPRMKIAAITYFEPWDWVIVAGTYEDDYAGILVGSLAAVNAMAWYAVFCAVAILVALSIVAVVRARALTRPIGVAVGLLGEVAKGNVAVDVPQEILARNDEIGDLGRGIATMTKSLREVVAGMSANSKGLTAASSELSTTATQLASGAEKTTLQSAQVAAAAEQLTANMDGMTTSTEQMSCNVKAVASAVEQLTASIGEVAKNAEQAAEVANRATQRAEASNAQITGLGSVAKEIGEVLEVIQDIAEQTSLLALNATIEAARAGDAGKGFSVVATEVKELAKQTGSATEDIRKRIEAIQSSTGHAVASVGEISEIIHHMNGLSKTIAAAVEEQSLTTRKIATNVTESSKAAETVARNVAESASATREIAETIVGVDQAAKQAAEGAAQTRVASRELSAMAEQFNSLVGQFKT